MTHRLRRDQPLSRKVSACLVLGDRQQARPAWGTAEFHLRALVSLEWKGLLSKLYPEILGFRLDCPNITKVLVPECWEIVFSAYSRS